MSDFTVTQALTPEELKKYNDIVDELQRIDFGIAQGITNKSLDDDTIAGLNEKRRQLEDKLTYYKNLSLSRLSGDKNLSHDFEGQFTDVILDEPISDEKTLSQKMAAAAADFYCKQYPDNPVYQYIEGETLTEYVDRLVAYLASIDEDTEDIKAVRAELIELPIDKVNDKVWYLLENAADKQMGIFLGNGKGKNKDKAAVVYYSINFDDLKDVSISKKLTQFDKRVYIATSALYNVGNKTISLSQIHYAMGNKSRPNNNNLQKIQSSIIKMMSARIHIDNQLEVEVYKKRVKFKYDSTLLPVEILSAEINGKLTDAAINILREPPLITYAKQQKQITTVKVGLLQSPLSKTETNLGIEDYIIEQIAHMRSGYRNSHRILFDTLYSVVKITDKKQRQRTPPKINELLQHYKNLKYIKDYSIDKTGIDIIL